MGFVEELGEMAIVSRMKRLAERMHQDNAAIFKEHALPFEPRWFLILRLLSEKAPLSIMELAKTLGITHPSVNQTVEEIRRAGFIAAVPDENDKRRRLVSLTPAGQALVAELIPIWQEMQAAAKELIQASGYDVMAVLASLEGALQEESYYERMRRHILNLK